MSALERCARGERAGSDRQLWLEYRARRQFGTLLRGTGTALETAGPGPAGPHARRLFTPLHGCIVSISTGRRHPRVLGFATCWAVAGCLAGSAGRLLG